MCVICVKKLKVDWPSVELIINCCTSNPHGFAFAWNENGELKNYKTMDAQKAVKFYANKLMKLDARKTAMVFHARIATHGSLGVKNCHCWISDGVAFAHNGILRDVPNRDDMTDSETFFQDYFLPVLRHSGIKAAGNVASHFVGTSKFAFLGPKGEVNTLGDYVKVHDVDENGLPKDGVLLFSNHSFGKPELEEGYRVPFWKRDGYCHGVRTQGTAPASASARDASEVGDLFSNRRFPRMTELDLLGF